MKKSKDFINRLYPFIYSDKMGWSQATAFIALPDGLTKTEKVNMIKSALRFGNKDAFEPAKESLDEMTTFKPFNMNELGYDGYGPEKSEINTLAEILAKKQMAR